jgi:DNA-binding GntR family transcriptional regulator
MRDISGQQDEDGRQQGRGSAASQAYDQLVEMLLSRRLEPDDIVQERRLATELGVSRTPLREAMHRLEGEGLLARRSDGALAVPRLDAEETLEVLSVRRLLEVEAAGAAAGHVPPAVLEALRRRVTALAASGDPSSPERLMLDLELHRAIGDACGNRCLARMIADLRRRTQLFATRRTPERLEPICAEHLAILDALASGDAAASQAAMAAHIDATRAGLMLRLRTF